MSELRAAVPAAPLSAVVDMGRHQRGRQAECPAPIRFQEPEDLTDGMSAVIGVSKPVNGPTRETMISGWVLEQEGVVRQASVGEGA